MHRGYVALWRKIEDHPFYKQRRKFSKFEAWIDLVLQAQHKEEDEPVLIGNDILHCGYGESLKSIRTWAARWRWSESAVRRFFELLQKMDQIRKKSEGKTTRITILNYSKYDPKRRKDDANLTQTRRRRDADAVTDNNANNAKNVNNVNISPEVYNFVDQFMGYVKKENPRLSVPDRSKGADTIDKLIRIDGYDLKTIQAVLRWALKDDFWSDKVLSLVPLRNRSKNQLKKFENIHQAWLKSTGPAKNEPSGKVVEPESFTQFKKDVDQYEQLKNKSTTDLRALSEAGNVAAFKILRERGEAI